ncbi:MAG: response regulator [Bacteroidales bacterium]|nr:response regulator [Bacteroidales bacterium]
MPEYRHTKDLPDLLVSVSSVLRPLLDSPEVPDDMLWEMDMIFDKLSVIKDKLIALSGPDSSHAREETLDEDVTLIAKDSILVIDDDPDIRTILMDSLSDDYRVYVAADGEKGLTLARDTSPDIIVTDITMPLMDGFELCRQIKAIPATSHIPVVILSGKHDKQSIIHALESGASDYVLKPADITVLKVRLRNILDERQRLRDTILVSGVNIPTAVTYTSRMDKEFIGRVMKVVESELSNSEFQMGDFCRRLAMSRTAFYNKLKALTGMGPNDFLRMARLNKAKELLSSHIHNVTEVSEMVGFSDPKYFSSCFKKQFNISPSKL